MATLYNLVSCNIPSYPSINNLCWDGFHPMSGLFVFINQVYNGDPIDTNKVYQLISLGVNVKACVNWLPNLQVSAFQSCTPSYGIFKYKNCETNEFRIFGFPNIDPTNNVLRKDGDCDCWEFQGEEAIMDEVLAAYTEYDNCAECLTNRALELCSIGERSLSYAVRVTLPPSLPPDKGFKECCYVQLVFGDLTSLDSYKNDYTGVYFKRPTPNSTVVFKLIDAALNEYFLNDLTYGTFKDFGGIQPDLSFYIVEWRKVLTLLGVGTYKIKQEVSIAGIPVDYFSNTFTLQQFSISAADKTARIDCIMNGLLVDENVNFKGTNFKTSLRIRGFFGNNKREFEQDNVFERNYNTEQVSLTVINKYILQGHQLPECITTDLFNFVLKGNELFCSDYNINNHSYKYEVLAVVLDNSDGEQYFPFDRNITIQLSFTDRYKNNKKINC